MIISGHTVRLTSVRPMGCKQMVGCADYVSSRELDVMLAFAIRL